MFVLESVEFLGVDFYGSFCEFEGELECPLAIVPLV